MKFRTLSSSSHRKFNKFADPIFSLANLLWENPVQRISSMTFSKVTVLTNSEQKFLTKSFEIKIIDSANFSLVTYPSQLYYKIGFKTLQFYMSNTEYQPRVFTVPFEITSDNANNLSPIPLLDVVIEKDKC